MSNKNWRYYIFCIPKFTLKIYPPSSCDFYGHFLLMRITSAISFSSIQFLMPFLLQFSFTTYRQHTADNWCTCQMQTSLAGKLKILNNTDTFKSLNFAILFLIIICVAVLTAPSAIIIFILELMGGASHQI